MFALLYYTELRATELVMLRRDQYTGSHLHNVARKRQNRARKLYVSIDARRYLDNYSTSERGRGNTGLAPALFLAPRSGSYMRREYLGQTHNSIAEDASKHRQRPIVHHPY